MIRAMVILFFTLYCSSAFCQNPEVFRWLNDSFPTYSGVVTLEAKSREDLYQGIREWITVNYNSSNDVIQYESPEDQKIIIKGVHSYSLRGIGEYASMTHAYKANHILNIECRDGRFKVDFSVTSIYMPNMPSDPYTGETIELMLSILNPEEYAERAKQLSLASIENESSKFVRRSMMKVHNEFYDEENFNKMRADLKESSRLQKEYNKEYYLNMIYSILEEFSETEKDDW